MAHHGLASRIATLLILLTVAAPAFAVISTPDTTPAGDQEAGLPANLPSSTRANGTAVPGDADGDGIPDGSDPDMDGDGIPNESDPDIDGDGIANEADAFRYDPEESRDTDDDGVGDNADEDLDGDGVLNGDDELPYNPNEVSDMDGDGIGDNTDQDIDGDGVLNYNDLDPFDEDEKTSISGDIRPLLTALAILIVAQLLIMCVVAWMVVIMVRENREMKEQLLEAKAAGMRRGGHPPHGRRGEPEEF